MSDDDDSDDTPVKKTPVKKVAAPVLHEDESSSEVDSDEHEDTVLLREMTRNATRKMPCGRRIWQPRRLT